MGLIRSVSTLTKRNESQLWVVVAFSGQARSETTSCNRVWVELKNICTKVKYSSVQQQRYESINASTKFNMFRQFGIFWLPETDRA